MNCDWPKQGKEAAAEMAKTWREMFRRCINNGDDHGWAAHEADKAVDRLIARAKREAKD